VRIKKIGFGGRGGGATMKRLMKSVYCEGSGTGMCSKGGILEVNKEKLIRYFFRSLKACKLQPIPAV